jgi:MFS superfamily sulfate permease-like transporter
MPLFHNLPEAVLGAIVIYAVTRMMKVSELKRFYQFHVDEFAQAMLALLGVVTVGILPGLAIAIALSLLRFIWGASHLSVSHLRPVPGNEHAYANAEYPAEESSIRGLEILRLNGPLFFANALRFRNEVQSLLARSNPLKAILINLHANFGIDLSSTNMLLGLVAEAKKRTPKSYLPSFRILCVKCFGGVDYWIVSERIGFSRQSTMAYRIISNDTLSGRARYQGKVATISTI